jgi:hypothetical protein
LLADDLIMIQPQVQKMAVSIQTNNYILGIENILSYINLFSAFLAYCGTRGIMSLVFLIKGLLAVSVCKCSRQMSVDSLLRNRQNFDVYGIVPPGP